MDTDPNAVLLVGKNINVMISAADRPELLGRHWFQIAHRFDLPRRVVFEQLMVDAAFAFAANAE